MAVYYYQSRPRESQLYHHGIKGMKWGVRRFQNKEGSLTARGRKRYADDDGGSSNAKPAKLTHRQKLEAKYREKGLSPEDAKLAASKRIKIEAIVGTTAALTVAAATAYVVRNQVRDRADTIIKAGTKIHRIQQDPTFHSDRAIYAAYKKADVQKYAGMMGKDHFKSKDVHSLMMEAKKDVKVASRKKAADAFADLFKNDPEFKEAFLKSNERFKHPVFDTPLHDKVKSTMTDKQLKKFGYDAFNVSLVNHDSAGSVASKKFYDKLKSMGYDAITDINDQKHSGYNTKKPLIIFNTADSVSLANVRKMTEDKIASHHNKVLARDLIKTEAVFAGQMAVGVVGIRAAGEVVNETQSLRELTNKTA